ncbi:hypothetical protein AVEN_45446-1 [Araneus ventricosus]|uniref:Uncharacterized protein n=1 Tax=Araneus ventricosus TaxID=182803 RepID=A0A4Y2A1P0_ARAVE|nr:hypothetical protein AVEN_45446-1 [Araneus ventricosus]
MIDNSENPNVLANEAVLSQAKEILDRLITAVDILVDNVPKTDDIEDALAKFDDILLEEGNSSFSDVHMIHCQCQSPEDLPGLDDESMEMNEEDAEYEHDAFYYEMLDGANNSQDLQQQVTS